MKARALSTAFLPLHTPRVNLLWAAVLLAALFWLSVPAQAAETSPAQQTKGDAPTRAPSRKPDVIYVPTPQAVVDKMLQMAEIKLGDVVYDLGCGDGRIVATAAKRYGVKAVGFDIDPVRVQESLATVRSNKVEHLVTIKEADIFTLDLREATVVFLYLLPSLNVRLMPQLEKLKPGSRILSHDFDMRGAKPVEVVTVTSGGSGVDENDYEGNQHTIYKWVVPWEKEPLPPDSEKKAGDGK
ncbi:MAG: methyltransferase domain-containing protein [Verrucomicrobiae bacterium]|nr:methyltransferase domain-containing protein [Verrucomicrobiae bacterium]